MQCISKTDSYFDSVLNLQWITVRISHGWEVRVPDYISLSIKGKYIPKCYVMPLPGVQYHM